MSNSYYKFRLDQMLGSIRSGGHGNILGMDVRYCCSTFCYIVSYSGLTYRIDERSLYDHPCPAIWFEQIRHQMQREIEEARSKAIPKWDIADCTPSPEVKKTGVAKLRQEVDDWLSPVRKGLEKYKNGEYYMLGDS